MFSPVKSRLDVDTSPVFFGKKREKSSLWSINILYFYTINRISNTDYSFGARSLEITVFVLGQAI